jgi:hypothetical protein
LVREISQHQYTLGEVPCLTAATGHVPVVRVADLHADERWPKFSDEHNRPVLIGDEVTLLPVIDLLGTPDSARSHDWTAVRAAAPNCTLSASRPTNSTR